MAAMEMNNLALAERCLKELRTQFSPTTPNDSNTTTISTISTSSLRVWRLEALFLEAKGDVDAAMALYDRMSRTIRLAAAQAPTPSPVAAAGPGGAAAASADALSDSSSIAFMAAFISRRRATLQRLQQRPKEAIATLVHHVNLYSADVDAYEELCDLYLAAASTEGGEALSLAAHCMEEILLHNPHNHLSHTKYADILYTLRKTETARKHYARALELTQTPSARALYGLLLCGAASAATPLPSVDAHTKNKGTKKITDKDKETQVDSELTQEAKRQLIHKYEVVDSQIASRLARVAENVMSSLLPST